MTRKKQKNAFPALLIILGGMLLLGAGIVLALQQRAALSPTPVATDLADEMFPDIDRVTVEEAKTAFDEGQAVFLDVRGSAAFEIGRIPGSILIPIVDLETRLQELDPADWIITYCT